MLTQTLSCPPQNSILRLTLALALALAGVWAQIQYCGILLLE